jgi:hypothetical protein
MLYIKSRYGYIFKDQKSQFFVNLEWKTPIWNTHFMAVWLFWNIFPPFGILYKDKSGNPVSQQNRRFIESGRSTYERSRVARFFLVRDTKTGKNVPNEHKLYRMVIKYPKSP